MTLQLARAPWARSKNPEYPRAPPNGQAFIAQTEPCPTNRIKWAPEDRAHILSCPSPPCKPVKSTGPQKTPTVENPPACRQSPNLSCETANSKANFSGYKVSMLQPKVRSRSRRAFFRVTFKPHTATNGLYSIKGPKELGLGIGTARTGVPLPIKKSPDGGPPVHQAPASAILSPSTSGKTEIKVDPNNFQRVARRDRGLMNACDQKCFQRHSWVRRPHA